jgi:hypothetical protein
VRRWRTGDNYAKLSRDLAALERRVGRPAGEFFRELLGGGAALAAYPRAGGEPITVLLIRAGDAELMQTAVNLWNEAERARTETITETVPDETGGPASRTSTYTKRTVRKPANDRAGENGAAVVGEGDGGADVVQFYLHEGTLLALSDDEAAIRDVARRLAAGNADNAENVDGTAALASSPRYRRAADALDDGHGGHRAAVYFNLRAWDETLDLPASPDPFERELIAVWRRTESVAVGVNVEDGLVIEAVALFAPRDGRPDNAPADAQSEPERSAVFGRVPASAVVAAGGRWDASGWGEFVTERIPDKERGEWDNLRRIARGFFLGRDVFDDILPALGPTWTAYLAVRADAAPGELPLEAVVTIDLRPAPPNPDPGVPVRAALENALTNAFSVAAALAPSAGRLREWEPEPPAAGTTDTPTDAASVARAADATIRYVEGFEWWQPAFAITADRLVLASGPAAIETNITSSVHAAEPGAGEPGAAFGAADGWIGASSDQAVLVNLAGWRRLIVERRRELAEHAAETSALSVDEAQRRIDRVLELTELFDAVFVTIAAEPDRVRLVIGGTAK